MAVDKYSKWASVMLANYAGAARTIGLTPRHRQGFVQFER